VHVATGTTFSKKELDMVFGIFDVNKDRKLGSDTLNFLYQNRQWLPVQAEKKQMLSVLWSLVLGTMVAKISGRSFIRWTEYVGGGRSKERGGRGGGRRREGKGPVQAEKKQMLSVL
jgi:hypothetical protein